MKKAMEWLKMNAPAILTALGSVGVVVTCVAAVRASGEAHERAEEAQREKGEELTVTELVLAQAPAYIPAAVTGAGTIACIFGAHVLNKRQQASLMSAYAAIDSAFRQYREQVRMMCGEETERTVRKRLAERKKDEEDDNPPWDVPQTFYINHYGKFFEKTMVEVLTAEYNLNRIFILKGSVTFNDFLTLLNLPKIEDGDRIGWEAYTGETIYGYRWIEFEHPHYWTTDHILVCDIETPFPPHPYEEEYERMVEGKPLDVPQLEC